MGGLLVRVVTGGRMRGVMMVRGVWFCHHGVLVEGEPALRDLLGLQGLLQLEVALAGSPEGQRRRLAKLRQLLSYVSMFL